MINDFKEFNYVEINLISPMNSLKNINSNKNLNILDVNWNEKDFNQTLLNLINNYNLKPL